VKQIFTVGYEGVNLADFTATLERSRIGTLLDVRELARISHTLTSPRLIFESTTNFFRSEIHPGIPLPQKIRCESKSLRDHLATV
jgi:hypothetical protein